MIFMGVITVYSEKTLKTPFNTLFGHNAELLMLKQVVYITTTVLQRVKPLVQIFICICINIGD
jgi:hypothetical protein